MYKRAIGATECPFDSGGGVQWLFGQCPNEQIYFFGGASLSNGMESSPLLDDDDISHRINGTDDDDDTSIIVAMRMIKGVYKISGMIKLLNLSVI